MSKKDRSKFKINNFAEKATGWIGSSESLVVHTIIFTLAICLIFFGVNTSDVLLVLTTAVSLEAIYLAIFIQMTVNRHTVELEEVSENIEEIQEDVEEIQEDVEEIQEDVEEIEKDVDEIQEDVKEMEEEIDEIGEDVDEIQEDVVEISEGRVKETLKVNLGSASDKQSFERIESILLQLINEVNSIKESQSKKIKSKRPTAKKSKTSLKVK